MTRKFAGRIRPTLETLEGRKLQSGLGASSQPVGSTFVLPYIEQENLRPAGAGGTVGSDGANTQIIAILIGL